MQSRCITVFDGLLLWLHSIDLIRSANCREIFGSALFSWHQVTSLQFNWPGFATPPIKYLRSQQCTEPDLITSRQMKLVAKVIPICQFLTVGHIDTSLQPKGSSGQVRQVATMMLRSDSQAEASTHGPPMGSRGTVGYRIPKMHDWHDWPMSIPKKEWRILGVCFSMWWKTIRSAFFFCDNWHMIRQFKKNEPASKWTFLHLDFFPPSHRTINFKMFSKIKTTCRNNWKMKMCLFLAYILLPSSPKMFFCLHFGAMIFTSKCDICSVSLQHFDDFLISFHFKPIVFKSQLWKTILNQKNLLKKEFIRKILRSSTNLKKSIRNPISITLVASEVILSLAISMTRFSLTSENANGKGPAVIVVRWFFLEKGANWDVKWPSEDERCEHRHVSFMAYLPLCS